MKKLKYTVAAILSLAAVLSLFTVLAFAGTAPSEGMAFPSADLLTSMDTTLAASGSVTIEAEFWIDRSTGDSKRSGVIVGNYCDQNQKRCLNIELTHNGAVRVYTRHAGELIFNGVDVRSYMGTSSSPKFAKMAIVLDTDNHKASLYLNGTHKQTLDAPKLVAGVFTDFNEPLCVGGDHRTNNSQKFIGKLKNVAIYTEARSEAKLTSSTSLSAAFAPETTNSALFAAFNLISSTPFNDLSNNNRDLSAKIKSGRSFVGISEPNIVGKDLTKNANTFFATVLVPETVNTTGVIFGNNKNGTTLFVNFEITAGGKPRLWFSNGSGLENGDFTFNVDIRGNEWVDVCIVYEEDYVKLYLDGAFHSKIATGGVKFLTSTMLTDFCVGSDTKTQNTFNGYIKDIALYSESLNAFEVATITEKGISTDNDALFVHYNFEKNNTGARIDDLTGNGYDASVTWYEREESFEYDYSFAVIGDTQVLVEHDAITNSGATNYTSAIYDWIVSNKTKKNIKLVMGLGDITEKNTDPEWVFVRPEILKLQSAGIPYTLVRGNHDSVAKLDQYFKTEANFTDGSCGFFSGTSLGNYYKKITVGQTKYMIFVLDYGAKDNILYWVGRLCDENPDYRVIITTHAYMYRDGTTLDSHDSVPPNPSGLEGGSNNGDQMWEKLVSKHRNILMVLSGHDPCANVIMRQDFGDAGNTVSQFLVDFQGSDDDYNYETGMIAMLYFSEDGTKVKVEYISAYKSLEAQEADPDSGDILFRALNQFDFTLVNNNTGIHSAEVVRLESGLQVYRLYLNNGTYLDLKIPASSTSSLPKSVKDASINPKGELVIIYTDGSFQNLGPVLNLGSGEQEGDTGAGDSANGTGGEDTTGNAEGGDSSPVTAIVAIVAVLISLASISVAVISLKKKS